MNRWKEEEERAAGFVPHKRRRQRRNLFSPSSSSVSLHSRRKKGVDEVRRRGQIGCCPSSRPGERIMNCFLVSLPSRRHDVGEIHQPFGQKKKRWIKSEEISSNRFDYRRLISWSTGRLAERGGFLSRSFLHHGRRWFAPVSFALLGSFPLPPFSPVVSLIYFVSRRFLLFPPDHERQFRPFLRPPSRPTTGGQ